MSKYRKKPAATGGGIAMQVFKCDRCKRTEVNQKGDVRVSHPSSKTWELCDSCFEETANA